MDSELFVQNVEKFCDIKGVKKTKACDESGAGKNIISQVKQGASPSVDKVQALARYLGVTTSDLLGETKPSSLSEKEDKLLDAYRAMESDDRQAFDRLLALMGRTLDKQ